MRGDSLKERCMKIAFDIDGTLTDYKIVVNFGKSFVVENMSTEEAMERFMKIQRQCLREKWIERLRRKRKKVLLIDKEF